MIPTNSDINILYYGGSGGFLFLHLLLLTRKYYTVFRDPVLGEQNVTNEVYNNFKGDAYPSYEYFCSNYSDVSQYVKDELVRFGFRVPNFDNQLTDIGSWHDTTLVDIIGNQWSIDQADTWKDKEQWPNNHDTRLIPLPANLHKVYFHCNDYEGWMSYPGKKVLLYTDIKTQIRMTLSKHAYWFRYGKNKTITNIKTLLANTGVVSGQVVHSPVKQAADVADSCVYLQDLLSNPSAELGSAPNLAQQTLLDNWKELHHQFKIKMGK